MSHSQVFAVMAVVFAIHTLSSPSPTLSALASVGCVLGMILCAGSDRRPK